MVFRFAREQLLLIEIWKEVAVEPWFLAVHLCHEVFLCGRSPNGLFLVDLRNVSGLALSTLFGYVGGREMGAHRYYLA